MQDAVCSIPVKDDERFPCLQKQRGGPLGTRARNRTREEGADHARVCLPRPTGVRGGSHPQHKCTFASLRTRFGSYCPLVPLTHVMLALVQQKVPSPQGVHATWLRAPVAAAASMTPLRLDADASAASAEGEIALKSGNRSMTESYTEASSRRGREKDSSLPTRDGAST
eukprot:CAMPEP_0181204872 /NCGR_PEP_ID=MMETSP1096-20121128/20167_1 /TAXON_ID=156174 ORGANISM="Chrysochromulina ericina, Strain CCMP281" /NCGR_SAMPLE_ID=MMETSP1096 /ASSEMBLY_ACC=CAM_ASM_000453 /LENGTH=168 /DNA_ID=CAMNT_0023295601 /DNA_START=472 /DNA_END=979 /DNA_ORIENTATION=+